MLSALCYGSINPDIVHQIPEFPGPGDDLRSITSRLTYGGPGASPQQLRATRWAMTL